MRVRLGATVLEVTVRTGIGRAMAILPEERAMVRAARRMPKPEDWADEDDVPVDIMMPHA